MGYLSNKIVFLLLYWSTTVSLASAHYCEWGLCKSWEYCCGENACCDITTLNTLLFVAMILGTLIVMTICYSCLYCNSQRIRPFILQRYRGINYVKFPKPELEPKSASTHENWKVETANNDLLFPIFLIPILHTYLYIRIYRYSMIFGEREVT